MLRKLDSLSFMNKVLSLRESVATQLLHKNKIARKGIMVNKMYMNLARSANYQ